MIEYDLYYRQYGIRRLQQIFSPKLFVLDELPRDSLIHYFTGNTEHPEIDVSLSYLKAVKDRRIYLDIPDVLLMGDEKVLLGNPVRKNLITKDLIRNFITANRGFKYIKNHYKVINDKMTVFLNNYNYLENIYKYQKFPMTNFFKWYNIQSTIYRTIEEITLNSNKNNFIFIDIPKDIIPSYSLLRIYAVRSNLTMLKIFDTSDKLLLLDFWKWLDPDTRKLSILNNVSIPHLSKVNVVFNTPNGRSCVLNLGYLYSWMKGNDNITKEKVITQLTSDQVQLAFLKLLLVLQSNVPEEVMEETPNNDNVPPSELDISTKPEVIDEDEDNESSKEQQELNERINLFTPSGITNNENKKPDLLINNINDDIITPNNELNELDISLQLKDIEKDLKVLDSLNKRKLLDKNIIIDQKGDEDITPEVLKKEPTEVEANESIYEYQTANRMLDEDLRNSADVNAISAAEYRKLTELIDNYKVMKDPYGSDKTVTELSIITKEELKFNKAKTEIISSSNIEDTSMLESTLLSFDSDYIDKVMKKDILSMIGSLQKSGIIIRKHNIEIDNSALGTYENHVLELKPIEGPISTVRFRIPKINDDGTFLANGNKYQMRKQRVD